MQSILLHGPPGSGKTVLAKAFCTLYHFEHIATGDLLSEHISQHTTLGQLAQNCITKNALVPDAIIVEMIRCKIQECVLYEKKGYVLDGFPRTLKQLSAMRVKRIVPLYVFILELNESQCMQRIVHRLWDPETREIYNERDMESIGDEQLRQRLCKRSGDTFESALQRLEAYHLYGKPTIENLSSHAIVLNSLEPIKTLLHLMSLTLKKDLKICNQTEEKKETHAKSFEEAVLRVQKAKEEKSNMSSNSMCCENNEESFEEMLVNGIHLIKHGRHGNPHMRTLYSDLEFQRIFWQKPMKKNENDSIPKLPRLEQSIAVCDIQRVAFGASTNILKRCNRIEKEPCYISLITGKRSLDLEAENVEMAHFLGVGFQKLLNDKKLV